MLPFVPKFCQYFQDCEVPISWLWHLETSEAEMVQAMKDKIISKATEAEAKEKPEERAEAAEGEAEAEEPDEAEAEEEAAEDATAEGEEEEEKVEDGIVEDDSKDVT